MNIQELYNEIDNQYNLYTSEQGANTCTLHILWDIINDYKKVSETPNYFDYYQKIASIMMHRIDGVVVNNGIKQKYTISGGVVRVQIIG